MTPAEHRAWRKRLGWSAAKEAAMLGVSARQVRRWDSGESPIAGPALVLITLIGSGPARADRRGVGDDRAVG